MSVLPKKFQNFPTLGGYRPPPRPSGQYAYVSGFDIAHYPSTNAFLRSTLLCVCFRPSNQPLCYSGIKHDLEQKEAVQ